VAGARVAMATHGDHSGAGFQSNSMSYHPPTARVRKKDSPERGARIITQRLVDSA